jgi:transposase
VTIHLYYDAPIKEGSQLMRGADDQSGSMFSYLSPEARVPQEHALRGIRRMTDRALARLSPRFGALYVKFGRPSVPPEKLLRALLLQALYRIRSERQLMEQLDFNILFRWFVGLGLDDAVWSPTTFTKNRDRLLDGDIAAAFFEAVLILAEAKALLSDEHFTVDGTLLEGWASQKSFQRKGGPPPAEPPEAGAIRRSILKGNAAAMPPISRRRIPTRGCIGKRAAAKRAWAISATWSWKTAPV